MRLCDAVDFGDDGATKEHGGWAEHGMEMLTGWFVAAFPSLIISPVPSLIISPRFLHLCFALNLSTGCCGIGDGARRLEGREHGLGSSLFFFHFFHFSVLNPYLLLFGSRWVIVIEFWKW